MNRVNITYAYPAMAILISIVPSVAAYSVLDRHEFDHVAVIFLSALCSLIASFSIVVAKRSEEKIRLMSAKPLDSQMLQAAIDSIDDCLYMKDSGGRWAIMNRVAINTLGLIGYDWSGKTGEEIAEDNPRLAKFMAISEANDSVSATACNAITMVEAGIGDAFSENRMFEIRKFPVFGIDGSVEMIVTILRDVTEDEAIKSEMKKRRCSRMPLSTTTSLVSLLL